MTVKVQCSSSLAHFCVATHLCSLVLDCSIINTEMDQNQEWLFPGHYTRNYKLKSVTHPDVAQAALPLVKLSPANSVMRADGSPAGLCLLVTCLRSAQTSSARFKLCVVFFSVFCCSRSGSLQELHCIFGFSVGILEAEKEVKLTMISHYASNLFCWSLLSHADT